MSVVNDDRYEVVTEFPTLYKRTSAGKIQMWRVWVKEDTVYTEHGQVDGKKQTTSKVSKETNVGKANYRSPQEQAVFDAQSMWNNRKDRKGYVTDPNEIPTGKQQIRPMLAKNYEEHKHKLPKDFMISAKLDGVRCLAVKECGKVRLLSRSGKEWDREILKHIVDVLENEIMADGDIFDGEIYNHDMTFEDISGATKRYREDTEDLQYWIYDIPSMGDEPFRKRESKMFSIRRMLKTKYSALMNQPKQIVHVLETSNSSSEEDMMYTYEKLVEAGYEGLIVRNPESTYKFGGRSDGLLKYKRFFDEEYRVVDVESGEGKWTDMGVFVCETESGERFRVSYKANEASKRDLLENKEHFIGKMLKVQYFEKTAYGMPRFPVGLGVREPEDMD